MPGNAHVSTTGEVLPMMREQHMIYHLKWLTADRLGTYTGKPYPPTGEWTASATPELCRSGWHACRWEDAVHHINTRLWIVELDGVTVEGGDKIAAERLRLIEPVTTINERTLRLFAADCAERVLPVFEAAHPNDLRPREATQAARDYADGLIDRTQLAAYADRAADAAAHADAAAASAYYAAASAAYYAADADAAAYAAANAAASAYYAADADAAAHADAADAAYYAERVWQTDRLLTHYAGLDPADFAHRDNT